MKKPALVFIAALSFVTVQAQAEPDSSTVEKFLLDFMVPDMPAFKALNTDPSDILRPSDLKKFAVMISPFYSNGKGVIPKNFALEAAPWKLASKNWRLSEYDSSGWKRFAYRSSFSLGAVSDSTVYSSKLSLGYRVSLLSKRADILRAAELRNYIFSGQAAVMIEFTELNNYWVINVVKPPKDEMPTYYATHMQDFNTFLTGIKNHIRLNNDTTLQKIYDRFITALGKDPKGDDFSPEELKDILSVYGRNTDSYIAEYKRKNWNASRLDIALAWIGESSDAFISTTRFSSFSAWATGALRVHTGGQLLLGGRIALPRSENRDSVKMNLSLSLRYYLGTQDFRGFIETQFKNEKFSPVEKTLLLNLGAELRLGKDLWITASAGLNNYLGEEKPLNKLVSGIDIRYGFNKANR